MYPDVELSCLARHFVKGEGVQHRLRVWRAFLKNNHVRFFDLFKHGLFHETTQDRSLIVMEYFVDKVRQQAIYMWIMP